MRVARRRNSEVRDRVATARSRACDVIMRVLYITQAVFGNPGAENTHATEVIRALVKAGVRVTVAHPGRASVRALGAEERTPPPLFAWPRRIWFQIWLFHALRRLRRDVDAIYVRQAALMIAPALLRRRLGIPIVGEFNTCFATRTNARGNFFLLALLRAIERKSLRAYDRVIVISSALKAILTDTYATPPRKIAVVHNGTNLDLMRPLAKLDCRRALHLPDDAFVIAFVGTLHPWQGISPLIEAVAELSALKGRPVHLLIAGTSGDEPIYAAAASGLGIADRVHFFGVVSHERVPHIISAADVAVAPGDPLQSADYRIRSPLKVYEYLACGRPVIAGELESIRTLFSGDPVGFLVKPGSVPELVAAMEKLRQEPHLSEEMGRNARRLADRLLSWTTVTRELLTVFRSVLPEVVTPSASDLTMPASSD